MILNTKSWELVKQGDFIVGDHALTHEGVTYHIGDDFPVHNELMLLSLYESNQITEKPVAAQMVAGKVAAQKAPLKALEVKKDKDKFKKRED